MGRIIGWLPLLLMLAGCARPTAAPPPVAFPLPQLPSASLDIRQPAAVQQVQLDGAEALLLSTGAQVQGSALEISAAAGAPAFEWAIWRYTPPAGGMPLSANFDLAIDAGNSAWIGVADYSRGTWRLAGPFPAQGSALLSGLSAAHVSPGGNIFLLAGAYSGTTVTVAGLELDLDVPEPQKFFIGGRLWHPVLMHGIDGETFTLQPGNIEAVTAGGGYYNFPDLVSGEYTVIAPQLDGVDVSPQQSVVTLTDSNVTDIDFNIQVDEEQITYITHVKFLLDAKCVQCHGPDVQWKDIRLDEYLRPDNNDAWHHAEAAHAQVSINNCPWPPNPKLNASQKQLLDDWIDLFGKRYEPLP